MRWLLDTNIVSETVKPRPSKTVVDWLAARAPDLLAISVVTLAELRTGIPSAGTKNRRHQLDEWMETALPDWFGERILPLTLPILTDWLQLGRTLAARGSTRDPTDLLIASTARTHDLIIVSRNVRDFKGTGTVVYDPWSGETHRMEMP